MSYLLFPLFLTVIYSLLARLGLVPAYGLAVYRKLIEVDAKENPAISVEATYQRVRTIYRWQLLFGVFFIIGVSTGMYILTSNTDDISLFKLTCAMFIAGFFGMWVVQLIAFRQGLTRYMGWGTLLSGWGYARKYAKAQREVQKERRKRMGF